MTRDVPLVLDELTPGRTLEAADPWAEATQGCGRCVRCLSGRLMRRDWTDEWVLDESPVSTLLRHLHA